MFAIKAKKMEHTEVLMPVNCSLDDDSEESLDFGILHMNNQEYLAYLVYKKQPYGPFRLQYRDNMGYDVIADKDIKERTIVCEYIGDVITFREAVLRHKVKGHNDSIMELKTGKNADETLVIWP